MTVLRIALPLFAAALAASAHTPPWIRDEGVVAASDMESLTFILRRGGEPADAVRQWQAQRSEEAIRKLHAIGVNLVILNFHKGAGLQAEAEDIAAARRFTEIAHRYGIRVAGYVGSSMMYETFFREQPDAVNWRQIDEFGRPIYYTADQTFRYMACRNNPGYLAYLRKVMKTGIEDVRLDLLHFDQLQWWPEPSSCRCRYCRDLFRDFLRRRYPDPATARLRFGFSVFDAVIPPPYNLPAGPPVRLADLRNPLMQEWAIFRAETIAQRFGEFDDYVHSLNPNAGVIGNPTMNQESSVGFVYGVDPGRLFAHGAGIWTEEPNLPQWTPDGRLVSQIRSFKAARAMGRTLFHWDDLTGYPTYGQTSEVLRLAESLAYDDANLGVLAGGDAGGNDPPEPVLRYVRFFRERLADLRHTNEIADVAVLRTFASNQFNPARSNVATVLFEQSLIQARIPYGTVFERHLSDLSRYKVLVLADQDALSDEQASLVRRFVGNGGGLVITGETGALTDWRTRRERPALADLYSNPRVVRIARVEPAVDPPPAQMTYALTNQFWKLPRNHAELIAAVRRAAGDPLSVEVDAPDWVAAELAEQPETNTRLLHLVNFKTGEPVRNIPVRLRVPAGARLREVRLHSPDGLASQEVRASVRAGIAELRVPELRVYDLLLFRFDRP